MTKIPEIFQLYNPPTPNEPLNTLAKYYLLEFNENPVEFSENLVRLLIDLLASKTSGNVTNVKVTYSIVFSSSFFNRNSHSKTVFS